MPVIETESLSKSYPRVTALDQLTIDVPQGVTGLVGANGAGKSTLIKILLGLTDANGGHARVLGRDVATDGPQIRERVGYMPEHDCLPPDMTATEFVVHMARVSGLPHTAARERTADTLRHVGLYEERYRPMGGYSTGMKQRVKLAQSLVHAPEVVFLDEPTNGLDPVGRDDMLGLIRRVHTDFGISVLVTSHMLGELERISDHVVVIDAGRLLRSSATTDFMHATQSLVVEVGEPRDGRSVDVVQALAARHLQARADGRLLLVDVTPGAFDQTVDRIRDTVADLGLGLVRMEQGRHHIAEIFRDEESS